MRIDHDLLVVLLLAVERQEAGGESLERAEFGAYDGAAVNAHLDELGAGACTYGEGLRAEVPRREPDGGSARVARRAPGRARADGRRVAVDPSGAA